MISSGGGDNASAPFILGELGDEIDTAPDLESSHNLMILVFDVGLATQEFTQGWVMDEGRTRQILADNSTGEKHVSECWRN
jgi:hypothetical protein